MDACCLNRPFDDRAQNRVRMEAEAVLAILECCKAGKWILAASDMIEMELSRCPDREKRKNVQALYSLAGARLSVTAEVRERSRDFQAIGIKVLDSLHLALAETYRQDVFLTTDDALLARAGRAGAAIRAANPVSWFMEATQYNVY